MKKTTMFKTSILASLVVGGLMALVSSCTKTETQVNKPAPTISLSSASTSNLAGAQVSTTVTVDAPEGGVALTATVNGVIDVAFTGGDLAGATTKDVAYSFTIPATATIGSVYTISFQATDKKGQLSQNATFVVTVSAVAAKTIQDVGTDGQSFNITANTTWTADKIWKIHGFVRVGTDTHSGPGVAPGMQVTGVTLTIEPGTVIVGAAGSPGGTLVVQRGNKISAIGTAAKPIVFTSNQSVGSKKAGDWGGVVICGLASNNIKGSTSTGVDGVEELEGSYGGFHGGGASSVDTDNSGTLKYVRIEYAGYPINPNQEINGLTMGSVGSGTTLSYIQVTYSNDDSFEWFGGAAKMDHLIAYKGLDDDFDTDNGFHGRVQFGLGIRDQNIADQSGSNGFESDNDANGSYNTPFTQAVFSNMTIIGGKSLYNTTINLQFQNVAQIRRNSKLNIINSFFTGYPNGIFIDNALPASAAATAAGQTFPLSGGVASATDGSLSLKNNVLAGVEKWGGNGFGSRSSGTAFGDPDGSGPLAGSTGISVTTSGVTSAVDDGEGTYVTANVSGLPFAVPNPGTPQDVTNNTGDFNHPNPPRGRIVAVGGGSFGTGVFGYASPNVQQINSLSGAAWFAQTNTLVAKWNATTVGINVNIFEPLNGAPTLVPTGSLLTSGASFSGAPSGVDYSGFQQVTYKSAFGTDGDWTTGWVNWNPQQTDYKK